jgi:prepilin-type N-terminal cleavage/methylation domain-containing protein
VSRPNGFTMIEMLMVIVVVSLCGLVALPKFQDALAQNTLHGTRGQVMSRFASARSAAMTTGRVAYLHVHGNQVYVTATPRRTIGGSGTQDTITPIDNIYTLYGVTLASDADSVRVDPNGVGGTPATVRLIKGSRVDTVRISAYGRVAK